MYDYQITALGLPTTGQLNGMVLINWYELVQYIRSLTDDDQLVKFMKLVERITYERGVTHGEQNSLDMIE